MRCRDEGCKADEKLVWNDILQRLENGALRFTKPRKYLHIHLRGNDVEYLLEYYREDEEKTILKGLGTAFTYLGVLPA